MPPPRSRMRFRAALAICLALGVLVNVLVAWACALNLDPDRVTATPVSEVDDDDFSPDSLDRLRAAKTARASDDEIIVCDEHRPGAIRRIALVDPYWHATTGFVYEVSFDIAQLPPLMVRTRAGWPMQALTCTQRQANPDGVTRSSATDRQWMMQVRMSGDLAGRTLPFKPLWPGFAINTLLYSALAWLVLFAPFAFRRSVRRRRNRCECCGYPRGVSPVCSECGAAHRRPTT